MEVVDEGEQVVAAPAAAETGHEEALEGEPLGQLRVVGGEQRRELRQWLGKPVPGVVVRRDRADGGVLVEQDLGHRSVGRAEIGLHGEQVAAQRGEQFASLGDARVAVALDPVRDGAEPVGRLGGPGAVERAQPGPERGERVAVVHVGGQGGKLEQAEVEECGEVALGLLLTRGGVLAQQLEQLAAARVRAVRQEREQPVQDSAAAQEVDAVLCGVERDGTAVVAGGERAAHVPHPGLGQRQSGRGRDGQVVAAAAVGRGDLGESRQHGHVEPGVAALLVVEDDGTAVAGPEDPGGDAGEGGERAGLAGGAVEVVQQRPLLLAGALVGRGPQTGGVVVQPALQRGRGQQQAAAQPLLSRQPAQLRPAAPQLICQLPGQPGAGLAVAASGGEPGHQLVPHRPAQPGGQRLGARKVAGKTVVEHVAAQREDGAALVGVEGGDQRPEPVGQIGSRRAQRGLVPDQQVAVPAGVRAAQPLHGRERQPAQPQHEARSEAPPAVRGRNRRPVMVCGFHALPRLRRSRTGSRPGRAVHGRSS